MASPSGRKDGPSEIRCECGSLLARIGEHGLEVKCRRCRRVVLLEPVADRADPARAPPQRRPRDSS